MTLRGMALALAFTASGCANLGSLAVTQRVDQLGLLAREPMVVELQDGSLFLAGYGGMRQPAAVQSVPRLWTSADNGGTWRAVNVGTEADGAHANSDVDLAVAPDGTLYFVAMGFDRQAGQGTHIALGVSTDSGRAWRWTTLTAKRRVDRPWVEVAPDGTVHVIWNDGEGVVHIRSSDRGRTWSAEQRIHPRGGSSHLAVGARGELAVRITPASASGGQYDDGVDFVAVSLDGGTTWQPRGIPGTRDWKSETLPRWVEPMAWDASGALYLLWTEPSGVWLARSPDHGANWTKSMLVAAAPDAQRFFPYLVARGPGELAATWFEGQGEQLRWRACRIRYLDPGHVDMLVSVPLVSDIWDAGEPAPVPGTGGEYLPVAFLRDGDLAVAVPIQDAKADRFGFSLVKLRAKP
jgi:hypothetical protein